MKIQTPMELNSRLAELLGWTNVVDAGGALLDRLPGGAENSRDQAAVPDWAGDWAHAGPLAMQLEIAVTPASSGVGVGGFFERYLEHAGRDAAALCGIVKTAIFRLGARP